MSAILIWKRRGQSLLIALRDLGAGCGLDRIGVWALREALLSSALLFCLAGSSYWLLVASDRYVSESRIVVQRTDLPGGQGPDILGGLLGASAPGRPDQMLLREHLQSLDMTARLEAALHLRAHFTQRSADPISRLWWRDAPVEWLHRYLLSRIRVEFDEYSGVLSIQTQAFDPDTALAINAFLLKEGEAFINRLAHQLAEAQVEFLRGQVERNHQRMQATRADLIAFQNDQGLLSPAAAAESVSAVIARLEGQRSELKVQRASLAAFLVANHPQIIQIDQQIAAIDQQLKGEQARLASPKGAALNQKMEVFQRLEAQAAFAQDIYRASLTALEKGQMDANRIVKKVSILQAASRPEYPLEPRRLYNATVFVVVTLLVTAILKLLAAIVREHRD